MYVYGDEYLAACAQVHNSTQTLFTEEKLNFNAYTSPFIYVSANHTGF